METDITYVAADDYYTLLELPPTATAEELGRAHKRLAKVRHPDIHPDTEWATAQTQALNRAYAVLREPVSRSEYDRLRWAHVGPGATATAAPDAGKPAPPPLTGRDAEYHRRDRRISYLVVAIEVVVLGFFMFLALYRALSKDKF